MVRVVLVDDEERIRLGLAKLIAQADGDCEVAGIYASAAELLADLERLDADLVISDVKMPGMNGLELLERLQQLRPDWRLAILSGFDEFQYARQALRIGVEDYLLKPVDTADLADLLRKVKAELRSESARDSDRQRDYARLLLFGESETATVPLGETAIRELTRTSLFAGHYAVFAVHGNPETPLEAIESAAAEWRRDVLALSRGPYMAAVVVAIRDGDEAGIVSELGQSLLRRLPRTFCGRIGASEVFRGPDWLRGAYRQAAAAVQHAWYDQAPTGFAGYAQLPRPSEYPSAASPHALLTRDFRESLASRDVGRLRSALRLALERLMGGKPGWNELKIGCDTAIAMIRSEQAAGGEAGRANDGPAAADLDPIRHANGSAFAKAYLAAAEAAIEHMQTGNRESWAIEEVKRYIQSHYKEELDLSRLAELVYLTPSYLSKLFKTETGGTITDYLISVRIERAKTLLRDRRAWKTYEVGEQIGYADPAYFNKVFKKFAGCTPKEFRERVRHSLSK